MAQNDLPQKSILDKIIYASITLSIVALIGFKCYDYYQVIELRQQQIELTQEAKAIQDSVRAFVERGKMACRVCKDYEQNDPNKPSEGFIIIVIIVIVCFGGGVIMYIFRPY